MLLTVQSVPEKKHSGHVTLAASWIVATPLLLSLPALYAAWFKGARSR